MKCVERLHLRVVCVIYAALFVLASDLANRCQWLWPLIKTRFIDLFLFFLIESLSLAYPIFVQSRNHIRSVLCVTTLSNSIRMCSFIDSLSSYLSASHTISSLFLLLHFFSHSKTTEKSADWNLWTTFEKKYEPIQNMSQWSVECGYHEIRTTISLDCTSSTLLIFSFCFLDFDEKQEKRHKI